MKMAGTEVQDATPAMHLRRMQRTKKSETYVYIYIYTTPAII
jgi:hypothetical protein